MFFSANRIYLLNYSLSAFSPHTFFIIYRVQKVISGFRVGIKLHFYGIPCIVSYNYGNGNLRNIVPVF